MGEEFGDVLSSLASNKMGILGVWITLIVFFVRNELNHRKLRSDSETKMREELLARLAKIETDAADERKACRDETRELRGELAAVNKRFFEFQMTALGLATAGTVTTKATTTISTEEKIHG